MNCVHVIHTDALGGVVRFDVLVQSISEAEDDMAFGWSTTLPPYVAGKEVDECPRCRRRFIYGYDGAVIEEPLCLEPGPCGQRYTVTTVSPRGEARTVLRCGVCDGRGRVSTPDVPVAATGERGEGDVATGG